MTTLTSKTTTAITANAVTSLPQTIDEAQKYLANPSTRQILDFYTISPYLRDTAFAYHSLEDTSFGTTEEELLLSLPLLPLEELYSIHDLLNIQANAPVVVQWDEPTDGANGDAADEAEDYWVVERDVKTIGRLFNTSGVCENLWAQAVLGMPRSVVAGLLAKVRLKERNRRQKKEQKRARRKSKNAQKLVRQEPEKLEKSEPQQDGRENKKARRKRKREAEQQMAAKQDVADILKGVEGDQKKQVVDAVEAEVAGSEGGVYSNQQDEVDLAIETEVADPNEGAEGIQATQADDAVKTEPTVDGQNLTASKRKRMNRKKSRASQKKQKVDGEAHVEQTSKEPDAAESVNANVETLFEIQAEPSRIEHGTTLELDYIQQQAVIPHLQPATTDISIDSTKEITENGQERASSDNSQEDTRKDHNIITGSSETHTISLPLPSPGQIPLDTSMPQIAPTPSSIVLIPPGDPSTEDHLAHSRTIRKTTSRTKSPYFALTKASTPRQKLSPTKSPYFLPATSKSASSPRVPAGTSCLPFPPLSSPTFGLIQETLAHTPFHLLLAVSLLNKTRGSVAIPIVHALIARYPTPESMAVADVEDIVPLIRHLGLQNNRAKTMVAMAKMWVAQEPCKGRRYRTLNYPWKGAGKGIGREEVVGDEDDVNSESGEEELDIEKTVEENVLSEEAIVEEAVTTRAAPHNAANQVPTVHGLEVGNVIDLEGYDETISNNSHTDDDAVSFDHTPTSTRSRLKSKSKPNSNDFTKSKSKKPGSVANLSPSAKRHSSGAWEIAHLPGVGAYAIDSWRIFCRDVLRGVASGWEGEDAEALATVHRASCHREPNQGDRESNQGNAREYDPDTSVDSNARDEETRTEQSLQLQRPVLLDDGETRSKFEPEWMRVLPLDKELRAYLRWKWLKKGWVWDQSTGNKTRVEEMDVEQVFTEATGQMGDEGRGRELVEEIEVARPETVDAEELGAEEGREDVAAEFDSRQAGRGNMEAGM